MHPRCPLKTIGPVSEQEIHLCDLPRFASQGRRSTKPDTLLLPPIPLHACACRSPRRACSRPRSRCDTDRSSPAPCPPAHSIVPSEMPFEPRSDPPPCAPTPRRLAVALCLLRLHVSLPTVVSCCERCCQLYL